VAKKIKSKSKLKVKPKTKAKKKFLTKQKGPLYYLGNLLIVCSLLLGFIIFYPVIATYLFPAPVKSQEMIFGDYITIPKINAQAPIVLDVDPNDHSIYSQALKKGVAHAKGTYLPGEAGRSFLFAHSSGNPLEQTNYNTVFVKLNELNNGDEILIKRNDKVYKYKVTQKKVVYPTEIEYMEKSDIPGIIIQTCWPIGTSWKRLLVFAAPVE
jgi:LPXTG-site transpeptidase (sortase) family protein